MLLILIITFGYSLIASVMTLHLVRGCRRCKPKLTYWKHGFLPRFTVRDHKGRFMANKVGIFYLMTQGV